MSLFADLPCGEHSEDSGALQAQTSIAQGQRSAILGEAENVSRKIYGQCPLDGGGVFGQSRFLGHSTPSSFFGVCDAILFFVPRPRWLDCVSNEFSDILWWSLGVRAIKELEVSGTLAATIAKQKGQLTVPSRIPFSGPRTPAHAGCPAKPPCRRA
jgi:hypothetical protein